MSEQRIPVDYTEALVNLVQDTNLQTMCFHPRDSWIGVVDIPEGLRPDAEDKGWICEICGIVIPPFMREGAEQPKSPMRQLAIELEAQTAHTLKLAEENKRLQALLLAVHRSILNHGPGLDYPAWDAEIKSTRAAIEELANQPAGGAAETNPSQGRMAQHLLAAYCLALADTKEVWAFVPEWEALEKERQAFFLAMAKYAMSGDK